MFLDSIKRIMRNCLYQQVPLDTLIIRQEEKGDEYAFLNSKFHLSLNVIAMHGILF